MSAEDKAANTGGKLKGKMKETTGKAVGNPRLEAEGKADQVMGDIKQAGEKIKDAGKDILGNP
ncbi:CsbD family protein [Streptomyces anandii]|uniref:CsbD family protein n=1 Tax=Streptomyces anandii TaxID=285454 RepID=A0ABW6HH24_9ACTN